MCKEYMEKCLSCHSSRLYCACTVPPVRELRPDLPLSLLFCESRGESARVSACTPWRALVSVREKRFLLRNNHITRLAE